MHIADLRKKLKDGWPPMSKNEMTPAADYGHAVWNAFMMVVIG